MKVHGRCHCGAITHEAEVEPGTVNVCHCLDCQMLTGSAFRANIAAPAERFRILTGKPREYVKTADSGARAPQDTRTYSLRLGALSEKEALGRPARQDLDQAPPVMDTAGRRRAGGRRPALTPVDFRAARSTRE